MLRTSHLESKSKEKELDTSALSLVKKTIDGDILELPKVKTFLSSIGRNSKNSKIAYTLGLKHFNNFIIQKYPDCNCESILEPLSINEINVYELLDSFVSNILEERKGITPKSVALFVNAIRSFLAYFDIDVLPAKFRRKVKMPKLYREDEEPIDASDIRKILLACNNRRLKSLLLVLASGAMRITEALAIRYMDLDFSISPTTVHIRKEYSKTNVARTVYISGEATLHLKFWLDWKYKNPMKERILNKEDLVFTLNDLRGPSPSLRGIYVKVSQEFGRLLKIINMDERKAGGISKRRKINIHSLRRHAKTVISEQAGADFSEYFLGHFSKSPYWTMKEEKRREIYATKVMKYLTFLDYQTLETTGKNIEAKLNEKDLEIQYLRNRDIKHENEMQSIRNQLDKMELLMKRFEKVEENILS